ncbi:T9SS type A sorting domain-containing protein [Flavobacterium sp. MAH-1]|uniref:T9SS type A sorting domain-containing protein n=1 Tax=Flavobacterium agri TaxID=2743471 RepID=A0A7Y9C7K9_9FLAO|nr:T9SS type A sorting domain-containing protein [Flavobacterium agri]NUY81438.1 T9SS type A sorting domain-containing protein [Flavobacterium agri]NYA71462.1 T9SS type A sorting domain-containing protein [Flavobacterium agri]
MKNIFIFLLFFSVSVESQNTEPFEYDKAWGTYFGTNEGNIVLSDLDSRGNLWVVTATETPSAYDGFMGPDSHQSQHLGYYDLVLAKFSPDGALLYATYYGGQGNEVPHAIKTKTIGQEVSVYLVGKTSSSQNIVTPGAYQQELSNPSVSPETMNNAFIAKFTEDGELAWATYYNGDQSNFVGYLDIDDSGNIYCAGTTRSSNLGTPGAFRETVPPPVEIPLPVPPYVLYWYGTYPLISKFDNDGNRVWATYYGPDMSQNNTAAWALFIAGIAVDMEQNIVVTERSGDDMGYYAAPGAFQQTGSGGWDAFLSKFSATGHRVWSTYYGGDGSDQTLDLQIDKSNNIYIAGQTQSETQIATENAYLPEYSSLGVNNCFLSKFDSEGQRLWGTYIPYGYATQPHQPDISLDGDGNVYFATVSSNPQIVTPDSFQESLNGNADALFMKFGPSGSLVWANLYGGEDTDGALQIHLNADNEIYLVGFTDSDTGIATNGAVQPTLNFMRNAMITKFESTLLSVSQTNINSFSLYPNPNNGHFSITGHFPEDSEMTLFDVTGRKVQSVRLRKTAGDHFQIELSTVQDGLYFAELKTNSKIVATFKIVVKN